MSRHESKLNILVPPSPVPQLRITTDSWEDDYPPLTPTLTSSSVQRKHGPLSGLCVKRRVPSNSWFAAKKNVPIKSIHPTKTTDLTKTTKQKTCSETKNKTETTTQAPQTKQTPQNLEENKTPPNLKENKTPTPPDQESPLKTRFTFQKIAPIIASFLTGSNFIPTQEERDAGKTGINFTRAQSDLIFHILDRIYLKDKHPVVTKLFTCVQDVRGLMPFHLPATYVQLAPGDTALTAIDKAVDMCEYEHYARKTLIEQVGAPELFNDSTFVTTCERVTNVAFTEEAMRRFLFPKLSFNPARHELTIETTMLRLPAETLNRIDDEIKYIPDYVPVVRKRSIIFPSTQSAFQAIAVYLVNFISDDWRSEGIVADVAIKWNEEVSWRNATYMGLLFEASNLRAWNWKHPTSIALFNLEKLLEWDAFRINKELKLVHKYEAFRTARCAADLEKWHEEARALREANKAEYQSDDESDYYDPFYGGESP